MDSINFHIPSSTIYVGKCPHPRKQCRLPTIEDFKAGLILVDGKLVSSVVQPHHRGTLVVFFNDKNRVGVLLPDETYAAALSLAKAFQGSVNDAG